MSLTHCITMSGYASILSSFCNVYFRLSLTLSCPMDLRNYPFDKQVCRIEMESCMYQLLIYMFGLINGLNNISNKKNKITNRF